MLSRPVQHRIARFALPLRLLVDRVALGSLIVVSIILLLLSKSGTPIVNEAAQRISDFASPIMRTLDAPFASIRGIVEHVGDALALYEDNERLREENRRLLLWQAEALRLRVQNESLRELLAMPATQMRTVWTTAQIIADSGGPFVQTRLVDAGSAQGVRDGMAVVNEDGLVGRVVRVGHNSSRVLLLTDFNSRIPVTIEGSRDKAILVGDNGPMPKLRFLPIEPRFQLRDRVLTSGEGGLFPAGLLVGEIVAIESGVAAVEPFVDWSRIDFVSVLNLEPVTAPEVDERAASAWAGSQ